MATSDDYGTLRRGCAADEAGSWVITELKMTLIMLSLVCGSVIFWEFQGIDVKVTS